MSNSDFINPATAFNPTVPGSAVSAFEKNRFAARLHTALDGFRQALTANPAMSEQSVQTYMDSVPQNLFAVLGYPVDRANLYKRNEHLTASLRPDGLLLRPRPDGSLEKLIAIDAKVPKESELPTFQPGEKLDLDKLSAGGRNLANKIRYCDYAPDAPRWLLLTCVDRLYLYDSKHKRWVIALNSAAEMESEKGRKLLEMLSWPELLAGNATALNNLGRSYELKSLEEQLEDELQNCRIRLAGMLYKLNRQHPALATNGAFDPTKLQRAVQRVLDRLILVQILQDKSFVNDLIQNDLDILQNVLAATEQFRTLGTLAIHAPSLYTLLNNSVFTPFAARYGSLIFERHLCDELNYGSPGSPEERVLADILRSIMQFSFREFDSRRLGTVYERYAGFRIDFATDSAGNVEVRTAQDMRFRKQSGTYYTPDYIVEYIVKNTLGTALEGKTPAEISDLRVLDPACGSGTFLIGAFDELASFYQRFYSAWLNYPLNPAAYPDLTAEKHTALQKLVHNYPRRILERHIYGVDLNPEAAEFATISLLLRALEWEKAHDLPRAPLPPILNQNIKVGNSLISGLPRLDDHAACTALLAPWQTELAEILRRRKRLADNGGLDSADRLRLLDEANTFSLLINEGDPASNRAGLNALLTAYFGDANGVREKSPFNWVIEFPEAFADLLASLAPDNEEDTLSKSADGFDCVIGNPPYIRVQQLNDTDPRQVGYLTKNYISASGSFDIYLPFFEQGLRLSCGTVAYIAPNKFFVSNYGAKLRKLITEQAALLHIVDFKDYQIFSDATTYTAITILSKSPTQSLSIINAPNGIIDITKNFIVALEDFKNRSLWTFTAGDSGVLLNKLRTIELTLGQVAKEIFVGVQTGADVIYMLEFMEVLNDKHAKFYSRALKREVELELSLLKPIVSGENIARYSVHSVDTYLLFPYEVIQEEQNEAQEIDENTEIREHEKDVEGLIEASRKVELIKEITFISNYPLAWSYLKNNEKALRGRDGGKMDKTGWWAFSRNQSINKQNLQKIAVPRLVSRLKAVVDSTGHYALDNVDVNGLTIEDDWLNGMAYLSALINSKLLNFFFINTSGLFNSNFFSANKQFLSPLPIKMPEFTTEETLRAERVATIMSSYDMIVATPDELAKWTIEEIAAGRTDTVHDWLAYLAEQMTELTRARRNLELNFGVYIAGYPDGRTLNEVVNTLSIPNRKRKVVGTLASKTGVEIRKLEATLLTSATDLNIAAGEQAVSFRLTVRDRETKVEESGEVCRAVLSAELAEFIVYSLRIEREKAFPVDRRRQKGAWQLAAENVRLKLLPPADLTATLKDYRTALAEAARLDARLSLTDRVIDLSVYELYGLDAAERAIIES
jgi:adenine-specific DNA-methyltransferase